MIKESWSSVRKILCVRLDNMGDVLMTTPAMRALRASIPDSQITLLASPSGAAVAPYITEVDDCIVYDAPWVKNESSHGHGHDLSMVSALAERAFDAAIIFTVYSQNPLPSALLVRLCGIRKCLAFSRENPYRLLSDWVKETEPQMGIRHEVQRQLDLVESIGARPDHTRLSFEVDPADHDNASRLLRSAGLAERPYIVVHPGASAPSRRYPASGFASAVSLLARQTDAAFVITAHGSEKDAAQAVIDGALKGGVAHDRLVDMTGRLTLGQLAAVIAGGEVLLGNNSGPAHVAAAVGTPVCDLYALTNPQHAPWAVDHELVFHDVSCKYCYRSVCPEGHHACLANVEPARVAGSVLALIGRRRRTAVDRSISSGSAEPAYPS